MYTKSHQLTGLMNLFTRLLILMLTIGLVNNPLLAQNNPLSLGNRWTMFGINRMHFQDFSMSVPAKDTCCKTGLSFLDRATVTLGGLSFYSNLSKVFAVSADLGIAYGYASTKLTDTAINLNNKKLNWSQTLRTDFYINFGAEKFQLQPYLFGGVHATYFKEQFNTTIPAGVGFRYFVGNETGMITAQYGYGLAFSENVNKNAIASVGLYLNIGKRSDKASKLKSKNSAQEWPKPEKSSNNKVQQPSQVINNPTKKVAPPPPPTVSKKETTKENTSFKGLEIKNTLPPPPKVITIEADKDKDGVVDSKDKCPTVPGLLSNNGCPVDAPVTKVESLDADVIQKKILFLKDTTIFVIHFDSYKYDLNVSFKILMRLKDSLMSNPKYHCIITGHTDKEGDESFNNKLSEMRAQMVNTYLSSYYIEPSRITVLSVGNKQPANSSTSQEMAWMNRRVEVKVFKPNKK